MRISDWSSDVCSSDLDVGLFDPEFGEHRGGIVGHAFIAEFAFDPARAALAARIDRDHRARGGEGRDQRHHRIARHERSEEHTSELQSLMRISYAVFCLKKNNNK